MQTRPIAYFVKTIISIPLLLLTSLVTRAQESYEISVYASPTMERNTTMFELHSNVSPSGPVNSTGFMHPLHETLEITTGITNDFEIGVYFFNRFNNGKFDYIGSHIRPRFTVPVSWNWKLGASLSLELGFMKDPGSGMTDWAYEIRPILDKPVGKHYFSFNPTFDGSFTLHEVSFSPNIKYAFAVNSKYALGIEYYGVVGDPFKWDKFDQQTHQVYAVTDLSIDPKYEINFGIGFGVTESSDVCNIKLILGRHIAWGKQKENSKK
jgi:hypothetical protein